ncbi:hypothetical protein E2C01_024051 [Portunus trituberculatus]|uniref:Uncharacterized protein n=1 Tax=Portunus trituberculatus TaxID=210409 RepID=A0A5B7E9M7_PORTR|nr:hypothetical protein [Portunus trituberculatus]
MFVYMILSAFCLLPEYSFSSASCLAVSSRNSSSHSLSSCFSPLLQFSVFSLFPFLLDSYLSFIQLSGPWYYFFYPYLLSHFNFQWSFSPFVYLPSLYFFYFFSRLFFILDHLDNLLNHVFLFLFSHKFNFFFLL